MFSKDKLTQSYQVFLKKGKYTSDEIDIEVKPDLSTQGYAFGSVDIAFNVKEK